jgi:hypothetical protein
MATIVPVRAALSVLSSVSAIVGLPLPSMVAAHPPPPPPPPPLPRALVVAAPAPAPAPAPAFAFACNVEGARPARAWVGGWVGGGCCGGVCACTYVRVGG